MQLEETLNISATSNALVSTNYTDNFGNILATATPGSTVIVADQFGTRNQFFGGQIGAQLRYSKDRWFVGAAGTLAIGATHESVTVAGSTSVLPVNGTPIVLNGGNYATLQAAHTGINRFAVAPEFQMNVGYQLSPYVRAMMGYNFLYLSSVARPGNQIDNTYDANIHPLVPMTNSSFWAQGINFSLLFSY